MVNKMENKNQIKTIDDYMNDETRVTPAERERIHFEATLIGKMIKAREERGFSQRELAEIAGIKQPAIARLESLKATPKIDTLLKVLYPLGYTLEIVPVKGAHAEA